AAMSDVPVVALPEPLLQAGARTPAQRRQARDVQELARRPVGLAAIIDEAAAIADHASDGFGELADGQVCAGPDIDVLMGAVTLEQEDHGVRQIVDIEELAPGRA